jgi:hypothetical protein
MLQNPTDTNLQASVAKYVETIPKQIVVEIGVSGKPPGHPSIRMLESFFEQATLEKLKETTYLSSSNNKVVVKLEAYVKPGEQSPSPMYVFPRFDENGQPYFTGDEKNISLHTELDMKLVGGRREYEIRYNVKPKKLSFKGEFTL